MCMGLPFSCPGHVEALLKSIQDLHILETWEGYRSCLCQKNQCSYSAIYLLIFCLPGIYALMRTTRALCTSVWTLSVDRRWKVFYKSQTHYESMCYLHLFSRTALLRLLLTSFCMWSMSISMVNENYQIIRNASNLLRQLDLWTHEDLLIQHFTNLYF